MPDDVVLHGYRFSVYNWIARLALTEKQIEYTVSELNPFQLDDLNVNNNPHPFNRVPVLVHDGLTVYETSAICRYIDEAFDGPVLQPDRATERARMNQIIAVTDAYGYWPLVRQVFSNAVFSPRLGESGDQAKLEKGLDAAPAVLDALENLADDGAFLVGDSLTLADIHLAPIISYFSEAEAGAALLSERPKLDKWFGQISQRSSCQMTRPA
jgi:glutathione S-transferase